MNKQGFRDYAFLVYGGKSGTASSYVTALQILDDSFKKNDLFALRGKSLCEISDTALILRIADFVRQESSKFKRDESDFFRGLDRPSYVKDSFCNAALKLLLKYQQYSIQEVEAARIVETTKKGKAISKQLAVTFSLDKKGKDVERQTRQRIGQDYFRKMVLANYDSKCCVTGLNVPIILRASHISPWAEDKANRMNPENGLCLSATYDAAFDKHLISFDEDYRMIVSNEIKDYYTADIAKEYFQKYEGKQMMLPLQFMPDKKLLSKHRELLVG